MSPVLAQATALTGAALGHHLFDNADQHRHTQVFEAASVAVAAELNPQVGHPQLFAQPIGPEQVGVAFKHADNVLVGQGRESPTLAAPKLRYRRARPCC